MGSMILRLAGSVSLVLALAWGAARPADAESQFSVPEAMLRAKPAVVLVISEVSAEVTLDCGSGPTKVTPPVSCTRSRR